jgi:hypothetical protein
MAPGGRRTRKPLPGKPEQQVRPAATGGWHLRAGWREINDCAGCDKGNARVRLYATGSISSNVSLVEQCLFAIYRWVAPETQDLQQVGGT